MRDVALIRAAMVTVADSFHAAKVLAEKCDADEEMVLSRLRSIDRERANAVRRMEMYHAQYDALQDELDRVYEAQAEAMVQG